jgi:pimeloyl-ACP methyl ester carboxylesterase
LVFDFLPDFTVMASAQVEYGSNNGKYLSILGTEVYYEEYGEGTPLLLLHGGFESISYFQKCIPILAKDYRIIIPDAPGLGRSEYAASLLSYQLLADYHSDFIDQLNLENVYVIGYSDGGVSALILAKDRPDKVKRLVAAGANYKVSGFKNLEEFRKYSDPAWVENEMTGWVKYYQKLSPTQNWQRYVSEVGFLWFEEQYFPKAYLEAIAIPSLIVYGDNDMITLDHGLEIHNAIKKSQFCVLPNCSHNIFWDKPRLILKIITDFFNGK